MSKNRFLCTGIFSMSMIGISGLLESFLKTITVMVAASDST